MGIFDALNTAVSGLSVQSFALQNISGNIANSQTTGFKGENSSFQTVMSSQDIAPSRQNAGGVLASSSATITVQGSIQSSSVATNMAVNGDGFFVVQKPTGFTAGVPKFNGTSFFTRAGDFQVQNGFLVNSAGYYLQGLPIDPATGNPTGSIPQLLQFQNNFLPAQPTTTVQYGANLPTSPITPSSSQTAPNSNLINPADFISNPLNVSAPATITGTRAALTPDNPASVTGNVDASGFTVAAVSNLDINGVSIPLAAGLTAAQVAAAITGSAAGVTASVNGATGFINLTGNDAGTTINIQNTSTAAVLTGLGLSVGSTPPVNNLLGQNAVATGQNLVIQFGAQPPTTITFGTGPGQIASLAALNTALSTTLNGGSGSVDANGNITLAASNLTDAVSVTGTATPSVFGMHVTSALPPSKTVIGSDVQAFLNESVGGGAITAFNSVGSPSSIQFRWAKTDSASIGAGHSDTWNLFYQTNASATGNQPAWVNVGTNFSFGANGMPSPPITSVALPNVVVNGVAIGNVQVLFGSNGLTQFADTNGAVNVNQLQQNGFAADSLQTLGVSDKGTITGTFSNGQTIDLAQVTLASFNGENFLQNVSGNAYAQTDTSGVPIFNASGTIAPASLEGSNADIADQFTKLIVTQQAYAANARVITTSNQMLQVATNMVQ
jgi:flagellar hook protein FlgE